MLSRTIYRIGAGQRLVEFSGPVALEQHPPIPPRARSDLPSCLLLDLPARVGGGLRALLGPTRLRQNRTKRFVAPGLMLISIDLRGSGRLRVMAPGVISAARARRACLVVLGTARPFLRPAAGWEAHYPPKMDRHLTPWKRGRSSLSCKHIISAQRLFS